MPINAAKLRAIRERLGLSQAEAARKAGMTRQGLNNIESGRIRNLRVDTLVRLATALGVPVGELL